MLPESAVSLRDGLLTIVLIGDLSGIGFLEYERYPLPREGDDVVGETQGAWNAADNVAGAVRGVCN